MYNHKYPIQFAHIIYDSKGNILGSSQYKYGGRYHLYSITSYWFCEYALLYRIEVEKIISMEMIKSSQLPSWITTIN